MYLPNPSTRAGCDKRSIFDINISLIQFRYRCIYPTRPHGQDVTKGQFFKRSLIGWNSEFSFSWTGCLIKSKEPSRPYYFYIRIKFCLVIYPIVLKNALKNSFPSYFS